MSPVAFPELEAIRTEMSEETVVAHFGAIADAIGSAVAVPGPSRWLSWRRWLAGLLIGAGVLVPTAAIASDSAVPGDALYSVKKLLEPLVSILDDDVVAEHRIEEAEVLAERGGDRQIILELIDEATDALAGHDSPGLRMRLDALTDRMSDRPTSRDVSPEPTPTARPEREPTPEPDGEPPRSDVAPLRPEPTLPPAPTPTPEPSLERSPAPDARPTPAPEATADRTPTPVAADAASRPPPDRLQPTVEDSGSERDRRG
jgi:hypothetical protein